MKLNHFRFILFFITVILLSSCLTTTDPTLSTDPSFVSLTLSNNDSVKKAVFSLNGKIIENIDSLPYKTPILKVIPAFSFKSTGGTTLYFSDSPKDTLVITGKDTINFTNQPIRVRNYAADKKTVIEYTLKLNVHQVQPELYVWKSLGNTLDVQNVKFQKTVLRNDSMFYYYNDGTSAYVNISKDAISWSKTTISNFPVNTSLDDMKFFNGKFYLTQDGYNIYSSSDGINWVKKSVSDFTFKSLLFDFQSKLWSVVQSNDLTYHFATTVDGDIWAVLTGDLPTNFPVRGFTSLAFTTRNNFPKVLVLGGYNSSDVFVRSNWSSQDCVYWINFSSDVSLGQHSLDSLAPGASIISYDKKLLLFGAISKNNNTPFGSYYRVSKDEGLSWQVPDTTYNRLRMPIVTKVPGTERDTIINWNYSSRYNQSVVMDKSFHLFIIGGYNGDSYLSEIWKGKLNRLSFLIQ